MKNCSGINCPMQYGMVDSATCPAAECCPNATPPLTNYDRIISKTPEELATLISENIDCGVCENVFGLRPCSERCCQDFWLDWLKQEVEDAKLD